MNLPARVTGFFGSTSDSESTDGTKSQPFASKAIYGPMITNLSATGSSPWQQEPENRTKRRRKTRGEDERPPYLHAMAAGGIGGSIGDMLMHSLDTVKTRQQGAPHISKYQSLPSAYWRIFREEGVARGLYGGVAPAFLGSLPGTVIFFGTYEFSKRQLLDFTPLPESMAYLTAGFLGDLCASIVYVPSEVLKTRLQLQGRHNNPHFKSGYNYKSTLDAARTIVRLEGPQALFHGYKATLLRDLPFSAIQFALYEKFQSIAKGFCDAGKVRGGRQDIGLGLEALTGATAGGLAGVITCPLDVVKTRIQTEIRVEQEPKQPVQKPLTTKLSHAGVVISTAQSRPIVQRKHITQTTSPTASTTNSPNPTSSTKPNKNAPNQMQIRSISTSSPSTQAPPPKHALKLNTNSILVGLRLIWKYEGMPGLFRGVGPRLVWTSIQSSTMLVMYQELLKVIGNASGTPKVAEL